VLAEEGAQLLGQAVDVDHLTLVEEARSDFGRGGLDELRRAAAAELGGGHETRLDVESYDRARLWL
jgi:hypothetical protein